MRSSIVLLGLTACLSMQVVVNLTYADTFGSGTNTFDIEFVPIPSVGEYVVQTRQGPITFPGNRPDRSGAPNPAGAVAYDYRIGKFEISEQMIDAASALDDDLRITHTERGPEKPATAVTWFEAARFVNWLNTSTGHLPAYKFNEVPGGRGDPPPEFEFALWEPDEEGYDPDNPFRNSIANYVLPTVEEWYKAAYYDPEAEVYYDFATGSNAPPVAVAGGTDPGTAVYLQSTDAGPADVLLAGGASPFGAIGMNGNVREWHETAETFDVNSRRDLRGGAWASGTGSLAATFLGGDPPELDIANVGFRVVSLIIPEPSSLVLLGLACLTLGSQRRLICQ